MQNLMEKMLSEIFSQIFPSKNHREIIGSMTIYEIVHDFSQKKSSRNHRIYDDL